jgi:hypothetical protein
MQKFKPYSLRSAFGVVSEDTVEKQPVQVVQQFVSNNPTPRKSTEVIEYYYHMQPSNCQRCKCSHCRSTHERHELLLWLIVIVVLSILIKVMSM